MTGTFHSIFNSFWFLIEQRETKFCERNKEIEREEEKKEKKMGEMTFRQTDFVMFYFKFSRFLKLEGGKIKYCHMFPRRSHF